MNRTILFGGLSPMKKSKKEEKKKKKKRGREIGTRVDTSRRAESLDAEIDGGIDAAVHIMSLHRGRRRKSSNNPKSPEPMQIYGQECKA